MKYSEGAALGSGLASTLAALVGAESSQNTAYEGQMDRLVKRDNLQSGIAKNTAEAAYKNYKLDREQGYYTPENLRIIAETQKDDPVYANLLTTIGDGSNNNLGKLAKTVADIQDTQYQEDARNYLAEGNESGANALNILRQPGQTTHQFFSNGMTGNKATGNVDSFIAERMLNIAAANRPDREGSVPKLSFAAIKEMLGSPTGKEDALTKLPEYAVPQQTMRDLVTLSQKTGLPWDSQENVDAYLRLVAQQQPRQPPQQTGSTALTPDDINNLNGLLISE